VIDILGCNDGADGVGIFNGKVGDNGDGVFLAVAAGGEGGIPNPAGQDSMAAPVSVQDRLERKSLCRPAMCMRSDEIEAAGFAAREQPSDFIDMFAGVMSELRHDVGIA
jgi:hypothetical protein